MAIDLESETIKMYEDVALTDELTDDAARMLLQWGEVQLGNLALSTDDETVFDEKYKQLRGLMKSINRFTGRRKEMDREQQVAYIYKVVSRAVELGYKPAYGQIGNYVEKQKKLDASENVLAMIALIEIGTPEIPLM